MRIAGVNIPDNKRVQIALTYIYGIGKARASKICEKAEVGIDTKVSAQPDYSHFILVNYVNCSTG